jgi:hypothetical protein
MENGTRKLASHLLLISISLLCMLCFSIRASAPPAAASFDDGTVTDHATELMWQVTSDGVERPLDEASRYCGRLGLGGYSDWRLPGAGELRAAFSSTPRPAYLDEPPEGALGLYWSRSAVRNREDQVWVVDAHTREAYPQYWDAPALVRCVRGGLLGPFDPSEGRVLHVPAEFSSIQEAIDAARDGDMVLVADGAYRGRGNKNLTWNGAEKHITVRSENGPVKCVIDMEGEGAAFSLDATGQDSSDLISGFTMQNGRAEAGGGVLCRHASPVISNCIITGNEADRGGGIHCEGGSPQLVNNVISENRALHGAGLSLEGSSADLINSTVAGNRAERAGGGMAVSHSSPTLINSILCANSAGERPNQLSIEDMDSRPLVMNSDVEGGLSAIGGAGRAAARAGWKELNLDAAPLFTTRSEGASSASEPLALSKESPCVNSGTGFGAPAFDILGASRPLRGGYDMGAVEWSPGGADGGGKSGKSGGGPRPGGRDWRSRASAALARAEARGPAPMAAPDAAKAGRALAPQEAFAVHYKGLTSVHLLFSVNIADVEFPVTARLMATKKGATPVQIASKTFAAPGTWSDMHLHDNLPPKSEYVYTVEYGPWKINGPTATLNNQVEGELLFDEVIDGKSAGIDPVDASGVTVPAGTTLTLRTTNLTGYGITVKGKLVVEDEVRAPDVMIVLHSAHELSGISNLYLIFAEGNTASTINGGHDLRVDVAPTSNPRLSEVRRVRIFMMGGDIRVEHGKDISFPSGISKGIATLSDSTIVAPDPSDPSSALVTSPKGYIDATDCSFRVPVVVKGGIPFFTTCQLGQLTLVNRNSGVLRGNVFTGPIIFSDDGTLSAPTWANNTKPTPSIDRSSFLGQYALQYSSIPPAGKIPIGSAYYGDANGPSKETGFLHRGAVVDETIFQLEKWTKDGKQAWDKGAPPGFWATGYVVGQNTIRHGSSSTSPILIQGRETLLSLDVVTSARLECSAKVYAMFDGVRIDADRDCFSRDSAKGRWHGGFLATDTANIVLPPTDKSNVRLEAYIDARGMPGYEGTSPWVVAATDLTFAPRPAKRLRMIVQPVRLGVPFYKRTMPKGGPVKAALESLVPAMLPIGPKSLEIMELPAVNFHSSLPSFSTKRLLKDVADFVWTSQGLAKLTSVKDQEPGIDLFVVVLENGAIGNGATSWNIFPDRRGFIFVEEGDPRVALHEMAHLMGVGGEEQYVTHPPFGLQPEGVTAFVNTGKADVEGFESGAPRVRHFPSTQDNWYFDTGWYDIMSNAASSPKWPIKETVDKIYDFLEYNLSSPAASPLDAEEQKGPAAAGAKRILMTAVGSCWYGDFTMDPLGTPGILEATSFTTRGAAQPAGSAYRLECYDAGGAQIDSRDYQFKNTCPMDVHSTWYGTFDVPDATRRVKLTDLGRSSVLLDATSSGTISTRITSPEAGSVLGKNLTVKWENTLTGGKRPLQHVVLFSSDGGAIWVPHGVPIKETTLSVPTEFLKSGDNISVKVVSSDGLVHGEDEVHGLVMENRPPSVAIISPGDGAVAEPGAAWPLAGEAYDVEDGFIATGKWQSSLDGDLSTAEGGVVLSEGAHQLTYSVKDSSGSSASAKVNVTVKAMPTVDLSLEKDSLAVIPPERDPTDHSPVMLKAGKENALLLKVRNTGAETHFTLKLYVKGPGEALKLLASRKMSLSPFQEDSLKTLFTPTAKGRYTFRGVISGVSPKDSDTKNNEKKWLVDADVVAPPNFSPNGGSYKKPVKVSIWTTTEPPWHAHTSHEALIRYTTDGTIPSRTNGTEIPNGGTVTISKTTTLKAMAYMPYDDFMDSTVSSATFTFGP